MSYNDVNELTSKYKIVGEQYTDNDIQDELDRARRKLDGKVGTQFVQGINADTDDQEVFNLGYSKLLNFDSVRKEWKDSYIDATNYTVDTDKGTVTFDTSYAEDEIYAGLKLIFYYTPTRFKDLELWYAIKSIASTTTLQTRDGETAVNMDRINEIVEETESELRSKGGHRAVRDHRPRFPVHRV